MAHRGQPVANKLCAAAWRQRDHESHKTRLVSNPPAVDASPPRTLSVVINRAKQEQQVDEQCERIDRENRLLLRRMTEIVQKHTLDRIHVAPGGVESDGKRSLNSLVRRKDLVRISAENNAILERITARRPTHDRADWARHKEAHQGYLHNIREKPVSSTPIPLPRFLREGVSSRPAHAYVAGNYSSTFRAGASEAAYILNPSPLPPATPRTGSSSTARSMAAAGSQSARLPSRDSYALPRPNRTGVSKATTAGKVHSLQPLTARSAREGGAAGREERKSPSPPSRASRDSAAASAAAAAATSPSSTSTAPRLASHPSSNAQGYIPLTQGGRQLGEGFVIVAVHEVPAPASAAATAAPTDFAATASSVAPAAADKPAEESKQSSSVDTPAAAPAPAASAAPFLSSRSPQPQPLVHALLFRSYDPLEGEGHAVMVPFSGIHLLAEVVARPDLLQNDRRVDLANALSERLELVDGELRFNLLESKTPQRAASSSDSASPPATDAKLEIAYTDGTGVHYYFDGKSYLPFPSDASPKVPA